MSSKRFVSTASAASTAPDVRPRLHLAALVVLAAGLSGLGCSSSDGSIAICSGENHCPPPSTTIPWALQLAPTGTGSTSELRNQLMPQDVNPLNFDAGGAALVHFRPTALVGGSVLDAQGLPIGGARIIARLSSAIPGQSDYSIGTLATDTSTGDKAAGTWTIRLPVAQQPSSQPYRFWMGFDAAAQSSLTPPLWRDNVVVGDSELPLRLHSAVDLAVVTGRIVNALGDGIGNLTVQVLDQANEIVSSTATSVNTPGALAGSYHVLVDPSLSGDPTASLKVVVRPLDPTMPVLEATLAPPRAGSETRVDFAVPSHRTPVTISLPIRGGSTGTDSVPVAGARVRAQVALEDAATMKLGHRAYYTATGESDADGMAKLLLIPAPSGGSSNLIYQVSISSPSHIPFASLPQAQVQVGFNVGTLGPVTLPLRARVRGRLLSASGAPIANAQIVATHITGDEPVASPFSSMVVTADLPESTTDVDGSFALRLDPGDYDLEFLPVAGTDARTSLDNQRVQSADLDLGPIRMPAATLGVLKVLSPAGAPVTDTKVRIFQLPDTSPQVGLACNDGLPCSRVAKLRAEVFTDQDGSAQCLLPAGPPLRQ